MNKITTLCLFIFIVVASSPLKAQKDYDTNYYRKYPDRLIVAWYQSANNYDIAMNQLMTHADSGKAKMDYIADANAVTGLEFDYDILSVSFGIKSTPPLGSTQKGKTTYTTFDVSLGENKWVLEASYRNYKGFYDKNTGTYDTSYKRTGIYYQNPSMYNVCYKTKFLYFFNHTHFSYQSGYSCNYQQRKSAFSWVFVSNLFYNKMGTDSSFAPRLLQNYFGSYNDLNGLHVAGLSAGFGGSWNLVIFKSLFLNLTLLGGIEPQWRNYHHFSNENAKRTYITVSGDFRASLGFNGKNFFMLLSSSNDVSYINSGQLEVKNKYVSGTFTLGYRFKTKTPAFYKKFQETKLYKFLD